MSIDLKAQKVTGLDDKELLLVGEGYIARPVTVAKSTISDIAVNSDGHYVIPQGTYLYGESGSLLDNPQQVAVAVVPKSAHAKATLNSAITVTAKDEGLLAYVVTLVVGTTANNSVAYSASTKTVTVTLSVDEDGAVQETYQDVVDLINDDIEVNSLIKATIIDGYADTVAVAGTATTADGGAETVDSDIDGVLYHSVDVTNGEAIGTLIIAGYINVDNMPSVPGAAVKEKLPRITFGRKD